MRIALVPSAYAPSVGGVEELTRKLAKHYVSLGDQVEVWTSGGPTSDAPEVDELDGIPVHRFDFALPRGSVAGMAGWPPAARATWKRLRAAHARFRPDVLHVQCYSGSAAYATALSRRTRTPLVVTLQGETLMDDHDIFDRSTTLRTALRQSLRMAQHVTACSAFTLADASTRFGLSSGKGEVVFNGVDLDEAGEQLPVDLPWDRFVLALGRAVDKKGFDLLIDAFAKTAPAHPEVGLLIGGGGGALEALRSRVAELGLADRVLLPGPLARPQVSWAMAHAEVFVMPSRLEPFGIVALEGWRAGRAVVVSSKGGAPEFVTTEKTGLVVDPFDTAALAGALDRLLGDQALRERLGAAGREAVQGFGWPTISQRYRAIYTELTAAG